MSKAQNLLNIGIIADTNKLSAKLKAISKHTAALAEELEQIDRVCPKCGGECEQFEHTPINRPKFTEVVCKDCGYMSDSHA